ncbi:MAG TPA: TIGR03118 family protein, partial [Flavitalea sp.]|nr:TIGR03118 family protein [Flavitalea sp.]
MKRNIVQWYSFRLGPLAMSSMLLLLVFGCKKINENSIKDLKHFVQVNLVGNNDEYSPKHVDPSLINAWGIAFSTNGIAWVNAEDGHVSAVYDKEGMTVRPPVNIPSPAGATGGAPTGIAFNGSSDFVLSNGQPARFIFVGVDGIISGWNQGAGNNAIVIEDNSATSAYTGLTIAQNGGANYLYAADFRAGKIQVWDMNFKSVSMSFSDPQIPGGYAPFNIQVADELLYVTYAEVGDDGEEEKGAGKGFVDVYHTDGSFV